MNNQSLKNEQNILDVVWAEDLALNYQNLCFERMVDVNPKL